MKLNYFPEIFYKFFLTKMLKHLVKQNTKKMSKISCCSLTLFLTLNTRDNKLTKSTITQKGNFPKQIKFQAGGRKFCPKPLLIFLSFFKPLFRIPTISRKYDFLKKWNSCGKSILKYQVLQTKGKYEVLLCKCIKNYYHFTLPPSILQSKI